jgi:hypothetical protein
MANPLDDPTPNPTESDAPNPPRIQQLYDHLNQLGALKEPGSRIQQLAHHLRELGVVTDPTQGGLVDPNPPKPAPIPSQSPTMPHPIAAPALQPAPPPQQQVVPPPVATPPAAAKKGKPRPAFVAPPVTPVQFKGVPKRTPCSLITSPSTGFRPLPIRKVTSLPRRDRSPG